MCKRIKRSFKTHNDFWKRLGAGRGGAQLFIWSLRGGRLSLSHFGNPWVRASCSRKPTARLSTDSLSARSILLNTSESNPTFNHTTRESCNQKQAAMLEDALEPSMRTAFTTGSAFFHTVQWCVRCKCRSFVMQKQKGSFMSQMPFSLATHLISIQYNIAVLFCFSQKAQNK